ncbi:MAG: histidine kinase [Desulfurococcales archaeon ex4484_42]|nr:MAG: histidine kinase [Desulfurococcales archaeon ex4484_42]
MPEVRRVQKFGRSTLMISLPAEWVKSVGLNPGDAVNIEVLEDGSLRLTPLSIATRKKERELRVKVSSGSSESLLTRTIYAGYVLGMDKIIIESVSGVLSETHLRIVRDMIRLLIGTEIIEYTPKKIVIQILIDPSKYSTMAVIGRMSNLVRFMVQHIETAITENKPHLLNEVRELENEVDRLHALTARQLILTQVNKMIGKYLGIKPTLATEYRAVIRAYEEAADTLDKAANILLSNGKEVIEKIRSKHDVFKEFIDMLLLIIDRVDRCLSQPDPYLVNEALNLIVEYRNHIRKYNEMLFRELGLDKTYLTIREFIERLGEAANALETIAETAFDIAVEKTGDVLDISKSFV